MANYNKFRGRTRYVPKPQDNPPVFREDGPLGDYGYVDRVHSNIREHPTLLNDPIKYSDENPYDRNVDEYKVMTRTTKLFVTDKKKTLSTDPPEKFSTLLLDEIRHIRSIRPLQVSVDYTPTATAIRNGFIRFPDFNKTEKTSDGQEYHCFFPVIQGTPGTPVLFNFVFQEGYRTEFKRLEFLKNKLRIEVLKENTTGDLVLFEELNSIAVEFEITYVDHGYRLEGQVKGH
jgi:hypothetical protein